MHTLGVPARAKAHAHTEVNLHNCKPSCRKFMMMAVLLWLTVIYTVLDSLLQLPIRVIEAYVEDLYC